MFGQRTCNFHTSAGAISIWHNLVPTMFALHITHVSMTLYDIVNHSQSSNDTSWFPLYDTCEHEPVKAVTDQHLFVPTVYPVLI